MHRAIYARHLLLSLVAVLGCVLPASAEEEGRPIDFARDVRPILSDTCFGCHGPDASAREAELRLDVRDRLFAPREAGAIVVSGHPDQSLLVQRITATDADLRMPPPDAPRQLTAQQIDILQRWIAEGALWQEHWAFVPPQRQPLPQVHQTDWPQSPLDFFVLARLEKEGLVPSPPAARETWIRRVTLDLTGLPPTAAEVQAYLNDASPNADERLVDRLLASPHFGERLAVDWLDAARYADTSGYQNDGPRSMWRWRDWVIDAFNRNLPFDQFTIQQIAGDMLPQATRDQIIATGFNRNHRGNSEGGIIPEEFAVEYVVDRVDTTFSVWLGLTMGCARCHDHKYDPLRQREFYQAFAYFNNVPEQGRAIKEGNSPPYVLAPTPEQEQRLLEFQQAIADAEQQCAELQPALNQHFEQWLSNPVASIPSYDFDWTIVRGNEARLTFTELDPPEALPPGEMPYEVSFVDGEPAFSDAPVGKAIELDGRRFADAGDVGDFGYFDKFSLAAWIYPMSERGGTIVSRMTDAPEGDGYSLEVRGGRLQLNLVKRWLDDSLRVETVAAVPLHQWTQVAATYDGSRKASGIALYVNGQPMEMHVNLDALNQTFATKEPLRIGAGGGPDARFIGRIADVRVYRRPLPAEEMAVVSVPDGIDELLALPDKDRSACQQQKLRAYFETSLAPEPMRQALVVLREWREQHRAYLETVPTVMVMQELSEPRPTHVLERGQYDRPGERVEPGLPSCLPPLPENVPNNRLGFALWLVDERNPLTARVQVNRYWQLLFGVGLVKTAEDFGIQGEPPSHPELLDWLAVDFRESGWDTKRLIKAIVLSATYRQSSQAPTELWSRDPENRLLARGPRFRLPAEFVRDQALFASGLMVNEVGGPSVKPYQPEGLWKEIATDVEYGQGHGSDLYRRSLYTYWKRTVAPPSMVTFDAFSRETCMVRRSRTNTPLQALATMNDVTFVEASRHLAQRAMQHSPAAVPERLSFIFQTTTARAPRPAELDILTRTLERNLDRFRRDAEAATALLQMGESTWDPACDPAELAAYTIVANLVMNLDEVLTKE